MMAWRDCTLGDVLTVKHGFAFRGEYFGDTGSHIVLTPGNFYEEGGFKRQDGKEKWYRGPVPKDYVLNQGDLIVAMTEQAEGLLGSSAIVPAGGLYLHNQRLGLIQLRDESKTDNRFVFYLFNFKPVRQQIRATASGVKIRHTAPSRIADVKVRMPCVELQRRIAEILSAYDDLIENNQRRIQILEQMARAFYREWFIEFRFPGHEHVRRVASPLGLIPEDWDIRNVKDVATVTYGFPFDSSTFTTDEGGTPVVRIRDIPVGVSSTFTHVEAERKYHIKDGHILVGMDGDFHMCIWAGGHAFQNQRVARFESNGDICTLHLFCALQKPIEEFNKSISGTTVAHLGDMHIKLIRILWPPAALRTQAATVLEPMAELMISLKRQVRNLRRTRDLLLPRLLSGQITLDGTAAA